MNFFLKFRSNFCVFENKRGFKNKFISDFWFKNLGRF